MPTKKPSLLDHLKPEDRGPGNWWKEPLLADAANERQWAYLLETVGKEAAYQALGQVSYSHRPYPFNVAKILNVFLPRFSDESDNAPLNLEGLKTITFEQALETIGAFYKEHKEGNENWLHIAYKGEECDIFIKGNLWRVKHGKAPQIGLKLVGSTNLVRYLTGWDFYHTARTLLSNA